MPPILSSCRCAAVPVHGLPQDRQLVSQPASTVQDALRHVQQAVHNETEAPRIRSIGLKHENEALLLSKLALQNEIESLHNSKLALEKQNEDLRHENRERRQYCESLNRQKDYEVATYVRRIAAFDQRVASQDEELVRCRRHHDKVLQDLKDQHEQDIAVARASGQKLLEIAANDIANSRAQTEAAEVLGAKLTADAAVERNVQQRKAEMSRLQTSTLNLAVTLLRSKIQAVEKTACGDRACLTKRTTEVDKIKAAWSKEREEDEEMDKLTEGMQALRTQAETAAEEKGRVLANHDRLDQFRRQPADEIAATHRAEAAAQEEKAMREAEAAKAETSEERVADKAQWLEAKDKLAGFKHEQAAFLGPMAENVLFRKRVFVDNDNDRQVPDPKRLCVNLESAGDN